MFSDSKHLNNTDSNCDDEIPCTECKNSMNYAECLAHDNVQKSLTNIEVQLGVKDVKDDDLHKRVENLGDKTEEEDKTLYSMIQSIDKQIGDKPSRQEVEDKIRDLKNDMFIYLGMMVTIFVALLAIVFAHISGKI